MSDKENILVEKLSIAISALVEILDADLQRGYETGVFDYAEKPAFRALSKMGELICKRPG